MFTQIPKTRLLLYMLCAGLLPIVFVFCYVVMQHNQVATIRNDLQELRERAFLREKKQATNMAVRSHYRDADHFYIDKNLETLTFLEPEVESLQKLLVSNNVADDETIKKRLEFLTSSGNNMVFSEGIVQSSPLMQETTETLVHPVEINNADLQKVLAKVEGIEIDAFTPGPSRPQLIVLDFKLDRKSLTEKSEVFVLNLKLLKREFP